MDARTPILAAAPVIGMLAALLLAACGPEADRPLQGYVEGEYVRIAAPFGGSLQQLFVQRGDQVVAGAPVFVLERDAEAAARREAEARQASAAARLANLKSGRRAPEVAAVAEQLRRAQSVRDLAAIQLKRQQELAQSGFVSGAALDEARAQVRSAEAEVASLQAQVATANLPARSEEIHAAESEVKAAQAAVEQSEWKLAQRAVAAPAAGLVHDTYYVVGDFVPAGSPVASILPPANVNVRFFVAETTLGRLQRGQAVTVACDGCPAPVAAVIVFISDHAEFTPPVLYSRDNRAKLVYRVEARPAPADAAKLHPGQPVDVTLPSAR
jgi:HlyD family secretion protein